MRLACVLFVYYSVFSAGNKDIFENVLSSTKLINFCL
uniref:Uncharacterized protein n=1 Tax=Myoviridae sp. ctLnO19 TaxID=2825085 RepID=A0A8S5P2G6_9CAUD|nr:MAG TPA: hypothetical protein [Myoviridae sp. ctLnO19]